MSKFFITGGAGFIGSFVTRYLIEKRISRSVVIFDHFARYLSPFKKNTSDYYPLRFKGLEDETSVERGETQNYSVVYDCLEKHNPDYIIHLAAVPLANAPNYNVSEMRVGSVDTTSTLLEAMGKLKQRGKLQIKKFLYISSSMVYGDFSSKVAIESDPTLPKEIYGTMKLSGEIVTKGLCNYFEIPYSIIRPSAVYGPTDMNRRVSQIFIEKAIAKEKLIIHGENEYLDFTFVKDLAKGIVLSCMNEKTNTEILNITYGQSHSLLDYVKSLEQILGNLEYEIVPRDKSKPKRGTLSISKAKKLIGYTPEYDLNKGIQEYYDFLTSLS